MDDALSFFCVTDLAEQPRQLRRVSATSYNAIINTWPKHLVMFVVGDWSTYKENTCFDVILKRGYGSSAPISTAGSLSLQEPVLQHTTAVDVQCTLGEVIELGVSCQASCLRHVEPGQNTCSLPIAEPSCHISDEEALSVPVSNQGSPQVGEIQSMSFTLSSPVRMPAQPEVDSESIATPFSTPVQVDGILSPPDSHSRPIGCKPKIAQEDSFDKLGEIDDNWPPSTQPGQVILSDSRTGIGLQTPQVPAPDLTPPSTDDVECGTKKASVEQGERGVKRKRHGGRGGLKKPKKVLSFSDQPVADAAAVNEKMSPRWGHAVCLVQDSSFVVLGGQEKSRFVTDSAWQVDLNKRQLSSTQLVTSGGHPERRSGHTAVVDLDRKMLYIYGGFKNKKWYSDVHALDLNTSEWKRLETTGQAPTRSYHSCTFFRGELLVFGGNFPNPDPEPDGCSNELHIFNASKCNWYKPLVSGELPEPRSGHSASLVDHRLVVFGGWDSPVVFNDIFVFDLELMEFKKINPSGTPPSARTWHASSVLPDKRVFVHGGYDGNIALNDAFVFDLECLAWLTVQLPQAVADLAGRAGHKAVCTTDEQELLVLCGGGDNCGHFFDDTVFFDMSSVEHNVSNV